MVDRLKADLIEQFKGKPNIEALIQAFEVQLEAVYQFFDDLRDLRAVSVAMGNQLDGVGDIVDLTRADAGALSAIANPGQILDDETYRTFLFYKIWKNTNTCTYPDIIKSFQMFWDLPLYYSESPDEPATMILSSDILRPEDNSYKLLTAPIIKAAGVKLIVRTITLADVSELTVVPYMNYVTCSRTELQEILPEHEFERELYVGGLHTVIEETTIKELIHQHEFQKDLLVGGLHTNIEETTLQEIIPEHDFERELYAGGVLTGVIASGVVEILPEHEFTTEQLMEMIGTAVAETNIKEIIPSHEFEQELKAGGVATEIEITDLPEVVASHSFATEETLTTASAVLSETQLGEVTPVVELSETLSKTVVTSDVAETLLPDLKPSHSFSGAVEVLSVSYTVASSAIPECEQIVFDFTATTMAEAITHELGTTSLKELKEDKTQ